MQRKIGSLRERSAATLIFLFSSLIIGLRLWFLI